MSTDNTDNEILDQTVFAFVQEREHAGTYPRFSDMLHLTATQRTPTQALDKSLQRLRRAGKIRSQSQRWRLAGQLVDAPADVQPST